MSAHPQRVRILYKTILKLHRGLPGELQPLGNSYVKDEFKRHVKCKPDEAAVFMNEWTNYALTMAKQLGLRGIQRYDDCGQDLTPDKIDAFNDEQIMQLYELMMAATNESTADSK